MKNMPVEIGLALPRMDAYSKATGQELFATDYYPPGLVWLGVKYAEYPHALIEHIDSSAAQGLPGVLKVLTAADMIGPNRMGIVESDQPIMADGLVRCISDPVVIVLAESRGILPRALEGIKVSYKPLPGLFSPAAAMQEGAPLVHEGRSGGNLLFSGRIDRGNASVAFEECAAVVEAVFHLPWQEHSYLETENGIAVLREDGVIEITAATQTPFRDRMELARAFGLPFDRFRIKAPYLGGAFGGKDGVTVQGLLTLAVLNSGGRPVKIWNSREASFRSSTKRHPAEVSFKLGAKADGSLHALAARIILDTGAYAHLGGQVLALAIEHLPGVYRIPNTVLEGSAIYTNNPVGGAFRGFGAPQALAGIEQMMDMLANRLNRDPLELRLQNVACKGEEMGSGALITNSSGIYECLCRLRDHALWKERHGWENAAPPMKRRAVGIAAGMQGIGYGPVVQDGAGAKIELDGKGKFRIYCGIADMGQGNNPTNMQVAGTILNQGFEQFELVQPDTEQTLPSGSSAASRTTFAYANALIKACGQLRENILKKACMLVLGAREDEIGILPGRVRHLPSGREISLAELASMMNPAERVVSSYYIAEVARHNPAIDDGLKLAGIPHRVFAYNSHLVRLEIDEISGGVKLIDYLAITDAGKVLNPMLLEQQVHGGIAQGIGYALLEDFKIEQGQIKTPNLATYIIPAALDIPDIESISVETYEQDGPYGMKGAGEISINLPLPAISNAVARALGVRLCNYPMTAERVLDAMMKGGA